MSVDEFIEIGEMCEIKFYFLSKEGTLSLLTT